MNRAARVLAWWRDPRQWSALALVVVLLLALPPLRALLEASMSSHMLVQMPLLAAAGFIGTRGLPAARRDRLYRLSGGALPMVLMTMVASSYWMLPRALDAALADPWAELAKFVSLPLLAGAPLALAWQRLGPIARGFLWTNVVSMLAVLGWLYMAAPVRVCNSYLASAQYDAGLWMVGIALAGFLGWLVAWMAGPRQAARVLDAATGPERPPPITLPQPR